MYSEVLRTKHQNICNRFVKVCQKVDTAVVAKCWLLNVGTGQSSERAIKYQFGISVCLTFYNKGWKWAGGGRQTRSKAHVGFVAWYQLFFALGDYARSVLVLCSPGLMPSEHTNVHSAEWWPGVRAPPLVKYLQTFNPSYHHWDDRDRVRERPVTAHDALRVLTVINVWEAGWSDHRHLHKCPFQKRVLSFPSWWHHWTLKGQLGPVKPQSLQVSMVAYNPSPHQVPTVSTSDNQIFKNRGEGKADLVHC